MNPAQRIYWPFLLSTFAIFYFYSGGKEFKRFLHPSSLLDVKILALNLLLKATLFPLLIFSSFKVSVFFLRFLRVTFPYWDGLEVSSLQANLIATLIAFTLSDLFRFLQHIVMHKLNGLRQIHRTHHTAEVLTPLTLYRAHPLESLMAGFRNTLVIGLTLTSYSFLFKGVISGWDILGVNLFGFLFGACLANLRHSHLPISFGPLEYIFISPRMHQIHHSDDPKHFNKNYGVALSIWDQLAGSFYRPSKAEASELSFGIKMKGGGKINSSSLIEALVPNFNINQKEKYLTSKGKLNEKESLGLTYS